MKTYTFAMRTAVSFDAGDEVIMSIAGHVSRDRLSPRSQEVHLRTHRSLLGGHRPSGNCTHVDARRAARVQCHATIQ